MEAIFGMSGVKLATAYYELIPSTKGAQGDITREFTGIGTSASKGFGGSFNRGLKSAVGPAIALLGAASVGKFLKDSVGEAREAQKVGALTNNVIKQTGGIANVTAKQVGRLSTAISNKTGVDDEAVQQAANLLLTFKQVRNETGAGAKVFDRATQAAADLSAAGFGDLNGSAKQLGKALNDPLKGISALGRAGVTFTEQQKAQIKTLVGQNDLLGAQKIILKEVESQVGGAAAASSTMGEKASVAFGNFKEAIGTALLPVIDDFNRKLVEDGVPAGEKFADFFTNKAVPAAKDFADEVGPLAKSSLPAISTALRTTRDILKEVVPLVTGAVDAFNSLPKAAQTAILIGGGAAALANKTVGLLPAGGSVGSGKDKKGKTKGGGKLGAIPVVGAALIAASDPLNQAFDSVFGDAARGKVDLLTNSFDKFGRASKITTDILTTSLVKSNVGRFAGELGINIDKVATSLGSAGTKGKAYKQALADIKQQTIDATRAGDLDKVFKLGDAYNDLVEVGSAADKARGKFDNLGKTKAAPKTSTPGLLSSYSDAGKFQTRLRDLDKMRARPTVSIGGVAGSLATLASIGDAIERLARKKARVKADSNASGTNNYGGGLTWVNEKGPELVNLPNGTQIIPANKVNNALSKQPLAPPEMASGASPRDIRRALDGMTLNIPGLGRGRLSTLGA